MDVRPGGASLVVLRGPDDTEFPTWVVYLGIAPDWLRGHFNLALTGT